MRAPARRRVEAALTDAMRAILRRAREKGQRAPVIETVIWMAARDLASVGHKLDVVSAAVKERVCFSLVEFRP